MAQIDVSSGAVPRTAVRQQLESLFRAAVAAVDGGSAVGRALEMRGNKLEIAGRALPDEAQVVVLAAGKAAGAMAAAVEEIAGGRIRGGLVVTKDGHGQALSHLTLRESSHPVPGGHAANFAGQAKSCGRTRRAIRHQRIS